MVQKTFEIGEAVPRFFVVAGDVPKQVYDSILRSVRRKFGKVRLLTLTEYQFCLREENGDPTLPQDPQEFFGRLTNGGNLEEDVCGLVLTAEVYDKSHDAALIKSTADFLLLEVYYVLHPDGRLEVM